MMKVPVMRGFSFGLTSGVITTLGLIVGLHSSTHSSYIIIGGILIIAIADAMSDALAMHVSQESENHYRAKEIWISMIATFLSKFVFALTFVLPILFFALNTAILISIIWGMSLIAVFSYYLAKNAGIKPYKAVLEHLFIAIVVIIITHYVGDFVSAVFV